MEFVFAWLDGTRDLAGIRAVVAEHYCFCSQSHLLLLPVGAGAKRAAACATPFEM